MTKLQKNVPIIEFTYNVILEIPVFKDILVKKSPVIEDWNFSSILVYCEDRGN